MPVPIPSSSSSSSSSSQHDTAERRESTASRPSSSIISSSMTKSAPHKPSFSELSEAQFLSRHNVQKHNANHAAANHDEAASSTAPSAAVGNEGEPKIPPAIPAWQSESNAPSTSPLASHHLVHHQHNLTVSPLLSDIANATATATALQKAHQDQQGQSRLSSFSSHDARGGAASAGPAATSSANRPAAGLAAPSPQASPALTADRDGLYSPASLTSYASSGTAPPIDISEVLQSSQSFITSIRECVSHATHITNNVLDLSRLEAGKVELLNDIVHPARVASLAIDMMSARAQEKDIELTLEVPTDQTLIKGDGTRLAQVFLNLLSNAIKVSLWGTLSGGMTVASI